MQSTLQRETEPVALDNPTTGKTTNRSPVQYTNFSVGLWGPAGRPGPLGILVLAVLLAQIWYNFLLLAALRSDSYEQQVQYHL